MNCKHYKPIIESHMIQIGEDEYGWPIGEEQHELVAEFCTHLKVTDYINESVDCKDCPYKEGLDED